ncbi:hypothetical protein [Embleya hyalina]|uniref:Uncharacterized protein n=1 Tax=Embleya hyalina TaxID=516124 RepID=A0A401Z3K5_9ACTN|nr:hypothetical protein [Embleya hyalina]GCE01423.1 hypothetical protein EHYA_09189 [Embleya hyalina]
MTGRVVGERVVDGPEHIGRRPAPGGRDGEGPDDLPPTTRGRRSGPPRRIASV